MYKKLWKSLLVSPAILGAALGVSGDAKASEVTNQTDNNSKSIEIAQVRNETELLNQINNYGSEGNGSSQEQVTSVSQFRDVQPTDWAFEALRSLVERYGCIEGYPDQTYRGNQALSRYEFAAGLNSCLNQMERIIAASEAVLREDMEKLQRLTQEFEAELAAIGARVDNLEGRVAFLEDHQFSTTTKLTGEVIFALTGSFGSDNDNQAIFGDRVRLYLSTSFTGEDELITRLAAGSAGRFTNDYAFDTGSGIETVDGVESGANLQTFNLPDNGNNVELDWLAYYRPIDLGSARFNTYIAAWGGRHDDYAPVLNPYFMNWDGGEGSLSTFAQSSPIYRIGGGGGIGVSYELGFLDSLLGPSTVSFGYMSSTANDPSEGAGLFNGDYSALGQFNFNIGDKINLGLTYVHGFHKADSPIFGQGAVSGGGVVGTGIANLSRSNLEGTGAEIGLLEDIKSKVTNTYGAQVAFQVSEWMTLSGFFAYQNVIFTGRGGGETWTYGVGAAFPDLGKEGSVLGIFAGVQPYLGSASIQNTDLEITNNNPIHIEGFYKYQLTDNISITPGLIWVSNPEQTNDSDDQVIGTLRTTFTF